MYQPRYQLHGGIPFDLRKLGRSFLVRTLCHVPSVLKPFLPSFFLSSSDAAAADPRIDQLRDKIHCVEDKVFSSDYHDPEKRSIGNALLVELNDGTVLDEVVVEYPIGHKRRVKSHQVSCVMS